MKLVSHSLSLRSLTCSHLVSRLPSASTNTRSISSSVNLTHRYSILTTTTASMPPPPKRKWRRPNGDRLNGAASGSVPGTPTTPRTAIAQQPKRPRVADAAPTTAERIADVKQMYSSSAGDASAKPFSALSGKLDKSLLDGLDKMGFE